MKKRGFTLIEVLAIIIILGVLASITYPMVKSTIEKNRKKGFMSSIDAIIRTTKMYIASNTVTNDLVISYNDEKIKTENNHFISGTVEYIDGEINLRGFSDGEYCANGTPGNIVVEKRDCTAEENASVPLD